MSLPARTLELAGMTVQVFADAGAASRAAAQRIRSTIQSAASARERAIIGLATGSTPEKVYANLVALHRAGEISFRQVTTYNLDEFYPIQPNDPKSYRHYMHRHLFSLVDLTPNHTHFLDGTVPEEFVLDHAAQFDRWIDADGGLDLQLLGIGRNGHIGFNEPSELSLEEARRLPTRMIELHPITRADAAKEFGGEDRVIRRALTIGIGPILSARSILMLATGNHKAEIVARSLTGTVTPQVPASLLQTVPDKVTWMIDELAATALSGPAQ